MKALIDRCGFMSMMNGRTLRHKVGASIVVGRRTGDLMPFDEMNHLFQSLPPPPPPPPRPRLCGDVLLTQKNIAPLQFPRS